MKEYFIKNLEPILIGFVIAILMIYFFNLVSDTIIKIQILKEK